MTFEQEKKINQDLLRPLGRISARFVLLVAVLGSIVLAGLGAWSYQMSNGLAVAGIKWPVYWGVYITNFVFWIGIYRPQPVEIIITIAAFAAVILLYAIFSKAVPIVSIWELKVGAYPRSVVTSGQKRLGRNSLL